MDFLLFETPVGALALGGEDGAICRLYLPGLPLPRVASHETPLLAEGRRQLLEYFAGERRAFDLPLCLGGTPFQEAVWAALCAIPFGQTRTYGQIAGVVGLPKGYRAVGMACHRNPVPILVPCHRVLGAAGGLTGYAGGLELKGKLRELEA